jgi:GNAT superfamily N-acetyltransferase
VIRAARPADSARIAVLTEQLGYPSSEADIRTRLATLGAREDHAFYVAEVDGEVAGWIGVRTDLSLEGGGYAEIVGLVVDERRRGKGLGEDLVHAAEAWARAQGATKLRVRSNVIRDRAHRFYLRLGYTITKRQVVFDRTD